MAFGKFWSNSRIFRNRYAIRPSRLIPPFTKAGHWRLSTTKALNGIKSGYPLASKCENRAIMMIRSLGTLRACGLVAVALLVIPCPDVHLFAPARAAGDLIVVDGDTIRFLGRKIRLEGIDAPEKAQSCKDKDGFSWPCGKESAAHLEGLVTAGSLSCDWGSTDSYGRWLATCHVDGRNIIAAMVRSGYAMAFVRYSERYRDQEAVARAAQAGLWQGEFVPPWVFRAKRWEVSTRSAPGNCPIKGNISSRGRIYHTPWPPHYNRTRINEARGERWFCTEGEALAAGWRPPSS